MGGRGAKDACTSALIIWYIVMLYNFEVCKSGRDENKDTIKKMG